MRSTFAKIFLSFWLLQTLIGFLTVFMSMHQFQTATVAYTSSFAMLQTVAKLSVEAYDAGGCAALSQVPNTFSLGGQQPASLPSILFDPSDKPLCQEIAMAPYATAIQRIRKDGYILGERLGPAYVLGVQVKDAHGQNFVYLMRGAFPTRIYAPFRGIVPFREILWRVVIGLVASIAVTFLMTLLITRPIGSLRDAARQLAAGNLSARANANAKTTRKSSDELRGLVYDFNVMAERLESLVNSQKLLLRDVSHELRSPLARLSVALEWAREEAQPGIEEQLERMETETVRLNALIGQLLSLAHLESASELRDKQPMSLASVVQDLLPDMDYEARARNRQVIFSTPSSVDCEVLGSAELIGRAIENVVRNAIAYTPEGTAVEIQITRVGKEGLHFAVLQVRDHGPGVPADALKSIFHPFYRLDVSRQRSTGGFGVGLAIAERAIQLHGGEVSAHNAPDGGLIVQMRLPLGNTPALVG